MQNLTSFLKLLFVFSLLLGLLCLAFFGFFLLLGLACAVTMVLWAKALWAGRGGRNASSDSTRGAFRTSGRYEGQEAGIIIEGEAEEVVEVTAKE